MDEMRGPSGAAGTKHHHLFGASERVEEIENEGSQVVPTTPYPTHLTRTS